ncbi:MAG: hypothetical protein GY937_15165 [bacterium]|nr:hypothetical protein [bacterium]
MIHQASTRLLICLLATALASCATVQETASDNPKAVLGSVLGAAAGAGIAIATNANPAVIAAAVIGGGLIGGYAGKKLDDRDKRMAREAAQKAFEGGRTGSSVAWSNPDSGNSGTVTPTRTYQLANGQYCRQYRQDIKIGNESHETTGTACRESDGSWQVQS